MNFDIFFISYRESNAEQNWERLISLHPESRRIQNITGIDTAHMKCNELCTTAKFWTVDGDNWLLERIPDKNDILDYPFDLVKFNSIDPIDGIIGSVGGIKLWTKNGIVNNNMSKGDFCNHATKSYTNLSKVLSEHRYNVTPLESWRHSFRHMVKCFSGIITHKVLQKNIDIIEKHKTLNVWSYRGYLDAKEYVEFCNGDFDKINLINDYDWLSAYAVNLQIP